MKQMHILHYFKDYKKQVFPAFCMILLLLFVGTDSYTTHLIDPNLERDLNPAVRFFQWGWIETWIYVFCIVLMTLFFAVKSNKYIFVYFENKKQNIPSNKFLFILCCLLLIYCFHNLIATFECSIHNYLSYEYNIKPETYIQKIAKGYVEFYNNFGITAYVYFMPILETIIATLITVFQIKRVKKHIYSADADL